KSHPMKYVTTFGYLIRHRLEFGHHFNWEKSEILDREFSLGKRLVSEMLFIKRQKNSLN
ncbi:hypothetical protein EAG_16118, partial [Camponotus floridanus]